VPTLTTVPLMILLLWLWSRTGHRILPAVAFVSVFTAASALNLGSVGLACWLFTFASIAVARKLTGAPRYQVMPGVNQAAVLAVSVFVVYAVVSGLVFPFLFAGVPVVRAADAQPLEWGMGNIAQVSYLAASFGLYLTAIGTPKAELDVALEWFLRGCVVAAAIAFYQLLNAIVHVPYPSDLFYSNPSFVIFPAYQMNGLWRLNGPFTEASDMAGYMMVGISLQGWILIHRKLTFGRVASFLMMVFALLMTQSSIGYFTVLLLSVVSVFVYVRYIWRGGALSQIKLVLMLLAVGAVVLTCLNHSVVEAVQKVITGTLFEKQNSESFRDRNLTHVAAMETFADTWYIGAGWGSARASGLIYVLLANTGVLGAFLFGCMLLSFTFPLFRGSARQRRDVPAVQDTAEGFSLGAILFALLMLLVTMLVAGSELGTPVLWILFGAATVATTTRVNEIPALTRQYGMQRLTDSRRGTFA
jgi:hypothetical protein